MTGRADILKNTLPEPGVPSSSIAFHVHIAFDIMLATSYEQCQAFRALELAIISPTVLMDVVAEWLLIQNPVIVRPDAASPLSCVVGSLCRIRHPLPL